MSDESKSPEAEVFRVAAAQDVQAALAAAQTRAEENALAAVAAVQAQVDARRVEDANAVQAEAEARQATAEAEARQATAAAVAAAAATAVAAVPPPPQAAAGGAATPAEILQWQRQVASEFSRIDSEVHNMKSVLDNVLVSMGGIRDAVAGGATKTAHVEVLLQQMMENFGDREPASREGGDARERHVQKSQLTDDTALWKKMPSRKHWVLRGRLPPNIGESAADLQSFVGEAVNVTSVVAAQLRAISDFDVA